MIGCLTETTTCVVAKPLVSFKEFEFERNASKEGFDQLCSQLSSQEHFVMLDFTWGGWHR